MVCTIHLNSTSDTSINTNGCEAGIEFRIGEDVIHKVASGEITFQSDGSAIGTVEYLTSGVPANAGAVTCYNKLMNLTREPTYAREFNTDTRCKDFRLTVDEPTMYAMESLAHIRRGLDDVGISLGSTVSLAPTAGTNAQGEGLSRTTLIIIIVVCVIAAILIAIGGVLLYKRLNKKNKK